ncbi:FAD/NAD(P)-binding domain-containing protein [Choiromyces venosus 120613-1]|uniref:FAD/NAD(P)-binding domain-containing protein n=1 Tax=Choiromyces venosus 120613-1 TaxID=1336337 RepID=A0A3N4JI94_9PEZI|nr:FAD/NAD(P)-binding domain-containing protein [Choiromyces venosus 120613-1]
MSAYISLADYLRRPQNIRESFHCRVGKRPDTRLGFGVDLGAEGTAPRIYGFPIPGEQSPTPQSVIGNDYFISDSTWDHILDHGVFDYIVVGSSFMALSFVEQIYMLNPHAKILILERGDYWLPSHFQNLPLPFKPVLGGRSETFPWRLSEETFQAAEIDSLKFNYLHGYCPFFGGRSTVWSSWCPRPPIELFRGYPETLINALSVDQNWKDAKELLGVIPAHDIQDGVFDKMQNDIDKRMEAIANEGIKKHIPSADYSESAGLAVAPRFRRTTLRHNKFSVPGPLLRVLEGQRLKTRKDATGRRQGHPLEIALNCVVQRLGTPRRGVRSIETSRGALSFTGDKTKIILCAGAVPNATLVLNSFKPRSPADPPGLSKTAGSRLTGHFLTHVTARFPKKALGDPTTLQIGAHYLAGKDPCGLQYHIQISAIHSPEPTEEGDEIARLSPDFAAAATVEQLADSTEHIVIVCASLGETDEHNKRSNIVLNSGPDPTTNIDLRFTFTEKDKKLWEVMDHATFQTIEALAGKDFADCIEYWSETDKKWGPAKPLPGDIRVPGMVHEGSTLFMGPEDQGGSVDENYALHGVKNVYVAGSALFPSSGSWNPTLSMCLLAQDLAKKLHAQFVLEEKAAHAEAGKED